MSETEPALSVILSSRDGWDPVLRTLDHLGGQTVAHRIELVLVLLGGGLPAGTPPDPVLRLADHRLVQAPEARSVAQANTAGVRQARAPVVVLGEDHAFPEPGWAEALLARHEQPWAVVGPQVENANPDTAVSWADFVLSYGAFAVGTRGGESDAAPGHNSSYKRAVLERERSGLENALAAEWMFHRRLRQRGDRVFVEPRAVIRHVNFSLLGPFLVHAYRGGRSHAASRAMKWSAPRRLGYSAGCVILPALRLARIARVLPAEQWRQVTARGLAFAIAGLLVDAAGQAAGFARGDPRHVHGDLLELEIERVRYVSGADASALR